MLTKQNEWRFMITQPQHGAWNMALDEVLLDSTINNLQPPTFRLYSWEPPCLSIGYAQSISDVDFVKLSQNQWDLVRRPTGGRAILHTDELTYSITAPMTEPLVARTVLDSYLRISKILLRALRLLGLNAAASNSHPADGQNQKPVCFEVPSNYEITVSGKKILGSAQSRKMGGVLQHGALPLVGDLTRINQVLKFSSQEELENANHRLSSHAVTVHQALGRIVTFTEAAEAMQTAFSEYLDSALTISYPTNAELKRVQSLIKDKYSNPSWTKRI